MHTSGGSDYDMRRFIIAKSPEGQRVGLLEFAWRWPDEPGVPVKFRVFAQHLPMADLLRRAPHIGLYDDPDGEPEAVFPLPVLRLNPLTGPPANN